MNTVLFYRLLIALVALTLISCGETPIYSTPDGPPSQHVDVSNIPDAVPQKTKRSRYGNPKSYVVFGKRYYVMPSSQGYKERGIASWYGSKFHGRRTSSGEPYDMHKMTAAHKTLPLPTYVRVSNLKNGRQVILKVNDRGPFHGNRIIDLSHTAALKLGIKGSGTGLVEVEALDPKNWKQTSQSDNSTYSIAKQQTAISTSPQPTPSSTNETGKIPVSLYLQLGAFISSDNAYQLKNRINSVIESDTANVSSITKNAQQFYRVRIGPMNGVDQADKITDMLTQKGFEKPRIVIE